MTGVVDLAVKLHTWRARLSEMEVEAERLRGKIAFAEEILKEENALEPPKMKRGAPIPTQSGDSLSGAIRKLFEASPHTPVSNENVFNYLKEKGVDYNEASVYATLSKWRARGYIELIKEGGVSKYRQIKPFSERMKKMSVKYKGRTIRIVKPFIES